ncbi:acyl-CoA dehydrogenase family protein [Sphingomonas sp. BIUV-7]|uniref:Acyl-CoA dehydrogenase family protein n=1 Tax=Sphingomonas natans TaxID=3063330 RepID=A0ABT8Y9T1_9SPHN|nr:acyl-CoA dehydrogenase family protein [Sphingomonas sp. BIUV-7]MDO6415101.1 acyl-CoA dehydrogenase family protein [Sphingomonas sp. BIUV-7]
MTAGDADRDLFEQLCALGAGYDETPRFPAESLAAVAACGLHRRFAPLASGGDVFESARAIHAAMFDALRLVGRGDLSVGRLFEGHVNALRLFDWYGSAAQQDWLGSQLAAGRFFGVWATEPSPGVALSFDGASGALTGAKSFASGAGGLDFSLVTVQPPEGQRRVAIVPANDTARADTRGWRVRGMRATLSGLYRLDGVPVQANDLLGEPGDYDRDPRFTGGAWRFTAVQLGGIEGLLQELRAAMSATARADPLQRAKFGAAVAATRTAWFWVKACAERAADEHPDTPAFAQMTRGIVERAALDVMELAARAIGTRSAFDGERADKIIRDLSLYLRQAGPDHARDQAALAWLDRDCWGEDPLW